jgi:hypothetical protein
LQTESEIKLARYSQVEKEADAFGRLIGVRRLKPSEQTKLAGMTADLTGSDEIVNDEGKKVMIAHRTPLVLAAAVCRIDESHIPFPRNRGELDAIYDRLDIEGLTAAGKAMGRLAETEIVADAADAKN